MKPVAIPSIARLALSLFVLAAIGLYPANANAQADGPVQVYILAGQSNMVGIGQVNPAGMTRYNVYVSDEPRAERGATLSLYNGAYDPTVDYAQQEPAETHQVMLGYWPHTEFPTLEGEHTSIARGFIRIDRPGRYTFRSTTNSICKINGEVVHSQQPGEEAVTETVVYEPGTYPIEVIFLDGGRSNLAYSFYDVPGALYTLVKEQGQYPELLDADGEWAERDDVRYCGVVTATGNQWLTIGCGAGNSQIGPELGFGWVMGDHHEQPVLILKASQGNRSLGWDFLPPGSERFEVDGTTYAGYRDFALSWETGTTPEEGGWYAGKQYDDCVTAAQEVLANFDQNFPMWEGRGYEIAGFVWWQGHKDTGNAVHAEHYEANLNRLIDAFRNDFDAPDAPFVVGTIGFHGWDMQGTMLTVANAQLAVSDYERYPDHAGNVTTVETRDFWRSVEDSPMNQDYHYNRNAGTYYQVGRAFGTGMIQLLEADADQ